MTETTNAAARHLERALSRTDADIEQVQTRLNEGAARMEEDRQFLEQLKRDREDIRIALDGGGVA